MLTFLNATSDTKWQKQQHEDRRLIRSFAAKHSHKVAPRRWKKKPSAKSGSSSSSTRQSSGEAESPENHVRIGVRPSRPVVIHPKSPRSPAQSYNAPRPTNRRRLLGRRRDSVDSQSDTEGQLQRVARALYSGQMLNVDASRHCPFNSYPVTYHKWFDQLIESWYYRTLPRSQSRIKATEAELKEYGTWSQALDMSEPALFYTSLFMASGIPVAEGKLPIKSALWLRVQTVRTLNQALSDPKRATSVSVILAVGRIALHEHVYGDRRLAHEVHRPAQQRMLKMAGGINSLNLPKTTIQMVVWADALMAAESGTEAYFTGLSKEGKARGYSQEEAMDVTKLCSPQRFKHPGYGRDTPTPDV